MPGTDSSQVFSADSPPESSTDASSTAARIAQNSVFEHCARAGFVMSGIVHLLIGYLAIRIAVGGSHDTADQSGAMSELATKPVGTPALWVAVVAFALMALWRLAEAALGSASRPDDDSVAAEAVNRVKALSVAVVYAAFALSAYGFAHGHGKSSGSQSAGLSARLMQSTVGTICLVVGALIIIAVGGYHAYKGVSRSFLDDLKGRPGPVVRWLGTMGYLAKGFAIAAAGVLIILAANQSRPDRATGLDGAFKTLRAQPFGVVLLLVAAVGIIIYGLYSFVMARDTKM